MKVKKNIEKVKKKKTIVDLQNKSGIIKAKKFNKVKKVPSNGPAAEVLKQDAKEQDTVKKQVSARQVVWNSYLKRFYEIEKLTRKQQEIMKFCANKSLTPPRRKKKFLNFIRNCYANQADFTDEQVDELFELLLQKFGDYKRGSYTSSNSNESGISANLSRNKKKKLARAAKTSTEVSNEKIEEVENSFDKVKVKKKKRSKQLDVDVDDNDD